MHWFMVDGFAIHTQTGLRCHAQAGCKCLLYGWTAVPDSHWYVCSAWLLLGSTECRFSYRECVHLVHDQHVVKMQLAATPAEDVMALFNEYILAMAECLLKGGDDPDTPAGRRLVRHFVVLLRG